MADARGSFAVEGARVAREVVEALLRTEEYAHAKTQEWLEAIGDAWLLQMKPLFGASHKLIVHGVIVQQPLGEGGGFKTLSTCLWDEARDDLCSVRWENASMRVVITALHSRSTFFVPMGNAVGGSSALSEEQMQTLMESTKLDRATISKMAGVFDSASPAVRRSPAPLALLKRPQNKQQEAELSRAAFVKLLEDGGVARGDAAEHMFSLFDTDGNGKVSMPEFLTHMALLINGSPESKLSFLFRAYDLDDSGQLTLDEVEVLAAQMLASYRHHVSAEGIAAEQVVADFLHSLDENGDGIISQQEFVAGGLKHPKLLPLLVAPTGWEMGESLMEQRGQRLIRSAASGKLDKVRAYVEEVPVDTLGDDGTTALIEASRKHVKVVQFLLERGASVHATNLEGNTPLHRACSHVSGACVDVLLAHKANVEAANVDLWTPLHIAASLGHVAVVQRLVEAGANINAVTRTGMTGLHLAALNNHPKMIQYLSAAKVNVNCKETDMGWTPLHYAAQQCHAAAVRALIDQMADVNARDLTGATPLAVLASLRASHSDLLECMKLLLGNQGNPSLFDADGDTPLHCAARADNVEAAQYLAQTKHALMLLKNKAGATPVQVAQSNVVTVLQTAFLSTLPDKSRQLLDAVKENNVKLMRQLAAEGADCNATDGAGNSCLYFAVLGKSAEAAAVLLQHGADPDRGLPLHAAILTGVEPLVTCLLDAGADAKAFDPAFGMAAIHTAARRNLPNFVVMLIDRGVSGPDDVSQKGSMSPLHFAAQRGAMDAMRVLLELGADKEARTVPEGLTPLHLAASSGRVEPVKALLKAGSSLKAKAADGRLAIHMGGDAEVVRELLALWPESLFECTAGGDTVLHKLAESASVDPLDLIAPHIPQMVTRVNSLGQTPLHTACRFASVAFLEKLFQLAPGVDMLRAVDHDGYTAIYYAAAARKEDLVRFLKTQGAGFREESESDPARIVFEPSPGLPKLGSATLDALLEYLCLTCDMIDDVAFRDVFFLSYRALLTPAELLRRLMEMYRSAQPEEEGSLSLNLRASSNVALSSIASSEADRRALQGGVPGSLNVGASLVLQGNRLRQVVVLRLIRHWIQHSMMDFSTAVALRKDRMRRRAVAPLTRQQSVASSATRNIPVLRGLYPDDNHMALTEFLATVDPSNQLVEAEIALVRASFTQDAAVASRPSLLVPLASAMSMATLRKPAGPAYLLDFGPKVAAEQMTLITKALWDKLSLWEFYGLVFTKDRKEELSPGVCQTIRHVNLVGDICKTSILESDEPKRRAANITFFIDVTACLLEMRNWSDAMALVTALQATSIERLQKSWRYVHADTVAKLAAHKDLFSPRGNYSNLRKLMDQAPLSEPAVPFLGIIMGDLIHVDEIPVHVEDTQRINFHKLEMLAKQLALVPRYQRLAYANLEVLASFRDIFFGMEPMDEKQVRARSRDVEPPAKQ